LCPEELVLSFVVDEPLKQSVNKLEGVIDFQNSFLIGGFVRDSLLGRGPVVKDLDIVTLTDFECFSSKLKEKQLEHSVYHKMLSSKVVLNGTIVDIVRARKEFYLKPGSPTYCEPASIEEDSKRRDFTVNAIMIKLSEVVAGFCIPVDLVGGVDDLEKRLLRLIKPQAFKEDPSRMIRLIRYKVKLNFNVEEQTARLFKEAILGDILFSTRSLRVILELQRLFSESSARKILDSLDDLELPKCLILTKKFLASVGEAQDFDSVLREGLKQQPSFQDFLVHFGFPQKRLNELKQER
jgi:tRNA nucleotidyltransferase (CCA-adding enzyme)